MGIMQELLDDVLGGHRLTEEEALLLMKVKGRDVWEVTSAADRLREEKVGNIVTYVRNQNLHITNICKNLCGFCGFGRPPGSEGTYIHGKKHIQKMATLAKERQVTEVCPLSGVHPDFTVQYYADMIAWVHEVIPEADIHTASPEEVAYAAKQSGMSTKETLETFIEAGLGTLQGTAAEILVDNVRSVICPKKINTAEWVRIIKEAHNLGLKSTSTIMYGSVDDERDRITHLKILRDIQDETGGFTELVPLSYLCQNTKLYITGKVQGSPTGIEDILMFAVSRLFLDNIDNIQISWGKVGNKMAQLGLLAGGNDLGGTMFCDDVSTDAGGEESDYLNPIEMKRITGNIDRELRQRTTVYEIL